MSELPSDDVLAAALAFIDAFDTQDSSAPSSPSSQSSISSSTQTVSKPQAKRARNESRERQKHEILRLRIETHQLEQQLQVLRSRQQEKQAQSESHTSPTPALNQYRAWAIQERQMRKRAEQQNEALRQRVGRHWSLAMKLDRTMRRYVRTIQEVEAIFKAASCGDDSTVGGSVIVEVSCTEMESSAPTMNTTAQGNFLPDEPLGHTDTHACQQHDPEEIQSNRSSGSRLSVRGSRDYTSLKKPLVLRPPRPYESLSVTCGIAPFLRLWTSSLNSSRLMRAISQSY